MLKLAHQYTKEILLSVCVTLMLLIGLVVNWVSNQIVTPEPEMPVPEPKEDEPPYMWVNDRGEFEYQYSDDCR